jgi:hypothetical protein
VKESTYFWVVMVGFFGFANFAFAGKVRTLYTNDRVMQPVYLTMGRSTILRFDNKPKTAVIGNQNYFSLEYIGNDITIQPQGVTSTNIFVYTENETYGLILQVGSPAVYDDLVNVRWKPGYINIESGTKKPAHLVNSVSLHERAEIKGELRFELVKAIHSVAQGVSILEMSITNLSREKLKLSEIETLVTDSNQGHPYQKMVMVKDVLGPNESDQGRIILRLERLEGTQIVVTYHGKQQKLTLQRKFPRS